MMSDTELKFDKRSIDALAKAMVMMHRLPAKNGFYFWDDVDETPDGGVEVKASQENKQGTRYTNHFMKWVIWEAPTYLLPNGSAPRYLRMEVVPEGVAVTHFLGLYGTTVIGLDGMPRGKDSTSPRVKYVTVPEEKFVESILFYLNQK